MRSSVPDPGKAKREREASGGYKAYKTSHSSAAEYVDEEISLTQEAFEATLDKLQPRHWVKCQRMQDFEFETEDALWRGNEFQKAWFDEHKKAMLPNVVLEDVDASGKAVYGMFTEEYDVVEVQGDGVEGEFAPVDYIAYNESYWFPVEVKDQRGVMSDLVGFRNKREPRHLLSAKLDQVKPLKKAVARVLPSLVALPGIIIKRERVNPQNKGRSYTHVVAVFSILPSF